MVGHSAQIPQRDAIMEFGDSDVVQYSRQLDRSHEHRTHRQARCEGFLNRPEFSGGTGDDA